VTRPEIEAKNYDLKAVNPNTKNNENARTPEKCKAKYYKLTRAGRRQVEKEARDWEQATAILSRFLTPKEQSS
jgi:PadR family transcriptional regulator PadR